MSAFSSASLTRCGGAILLLAGTSACTTPMLSEAALARAERRCGIPERHLEQDDEERRFLMMYPLWPSAERETQIACVERFAERRRLQLIYIEAVEVAE